MKWVRPENFKLPEFTTKFSFRVFGTYVFMVGGDFDTNEYQCVELVWRKESGFFFKDCYGMEYHLPFSAEKTGIWGILGPINKLGWEERP